MFTEKGLPSNVRRSFQIVIGLEEGYGTGILHTPERVRGIISEWMYIQMQRNLPFLPGVLLSGSMIYGWNSPATVPEIRTEDVVLFVGEVNPLYNAELTDEEAVHLLKDLASFIGRKLNQSRMYVTYRDEIHILESDKIVHPTAGGPTGSARQNLRLAADVAETRS